MGIALGVAVDGEADHRDGDVAVDADVVPCVVTVRLNTGAGRTPDRTPDVLKRKRGAEVYYVKAWDWLISLLAEERNFKYSRGSSMHTAFSCTHSFGRLKCERNATQLE